LVVSREQVTEKRAKPFEARFSGAACLLEGGLDAVSDEEEGGASLHLQRLAGMVVSTKTGVW
jgi:hypothetical protein